jgi:glutathione peroxidase
MIVNHCVRKKICLAAFILLLCHGLKAQDSLFFDLGPENTVYQFKCKDIRGNEFDFSCLEGKLILIVNTGSKCMYRKQLEELQELYEKYRKNNFEIVAFPSRDFFSREKNNNRKINNHYQKKYHINFPVMALSHVKGQDIDPVYDFLSYKVKNGRFDATPKWNFHKYLIDQRGILYKSVDPSVSPLDKEIAEWIEKNKS